LPAILNSGFGTFLGISVPCWGGLSAGQGGVWSGWSYRRRGDGQKQMVPVPKHHVSGDGPQMLEEAIGRTARDDGGSPGEDAEISGGVEREGQQVEGDQNTGEGFLAVAKVVFEIVSVGLQHVEGLVLDLPPGAAAGGECGDGIGRDGEIGDEAVGIGSLSFGVEDLDGSSRWKTGRIAGSPEVSEFLCVRRSSVSPTIGRPTVSDV